MLQVYDLRTLHPVGPAVSEPVDFGGTHVLSPDGTYVACRAKGYHSSIAVVNARTGQALPAIEVDPEPKRFAFPVDFAGKSRLLTMCHNSLFPEGGEQTVYQVWDLPAGKEVARFQTGLVWNGNYGSVSPGGRYFVMEKTETRSYHLLAWDLTTGKSAGETEFQGKDEPWGQASGMVFSPNGNELAVVWRLGKKDLWGKVMVFDVATGKKVASIPLDYTMKNIGLALNVGENRSLQWNPAGDGWLLLGHLLVDRKTGEVTGTIGKEPGAKWEVQPRRFVGPEFVTALVPKGMGKQLAFEAVPKTK
jgi:WD40 repeat protein